MDVEIHEKAVVKFVEMLGFDNIQKLGEGGMGWAWPTVVGLGQTGQPACSN